MAMKIFLGFASVLLTFSAHAATAQDIVGEYFIARITVTTCRLTYTLGAQKSNAGEITAKDAYLEYLTCKSDLEKSTKSTYSKLLPKIKSATGKAALKDFQISLMTSIEGSEPRSDERKSQYEGRISALDEKVESAWQRLQLEL